MIKIPYREKYLSKKSHVPVLVDNKTKEPVKTSPFRLMSELGYTQRYIQGRNSDHSVYDVHTTMRYLSIAIVSYAAELWQQDIANYHKNLLTAEQIQADAISKAFQRYKARIPEDCREMVEIDVDLMRPMSVGFMQYFYTADTTTKTAFIKPRDRELFLLILKQLMFCHIAEQQCAITCHLQIDPELAELHNKVNAFLRFIDQQRPKGQLSQAEIYKQISPLCDLTIRIYMNRVQKEFWDAIEEDIKLNYPSQYRQMMAKAEKEEPKPVQTSEPKPKPKRTNRKPVKAAKRTEPQSRELTAQDLERLRTKFEGSITVRK